MEYETEQQGGISTLVRPEIVATLDGDHDRMSHIVYEGIKDDETNEFISVQPTVVEGMINGVPVKALCGKIWVPKMGGGRYPVCGTCKDIATGRGWRVPV